MKHPQMIVPADAQTTFIEVWKWGQELERLYELFPFIKARAVY